MGSKLWPVLFQKLLIEFIEMVILTLMGSLFVFAIG